MKKIFSLLTVLVMALSISAGVPASAKLVHSKQQTVLTAKRHHPVQHKSVRQPEMQKPMPRMVAEDATVFLDPLTQTAVSSQADINLTINGITISYYGTLNMPTEYVPNADFRVFAGKSLTLSASSNITKVRIIGLAKAGFTGSTNKGTITAGNSYAEETTKATWQDPLIVIEGINATSVTLDCAKQIRIYMIEVTLGEGGDTPPTPPTPVGDTIPLTSLDAFEFGYYGSYSEEGAYNYSLIVYNSQSEEYVPLVNFDIYTEVKDEFIGNFTDEGGNLGLEYSTFYPTADSEGESFTGASVTIAEGEDDALVIEGIFTTEAGKTYTFSITAKPYIYDAEHPYEPQETKTFNLTAVSGEFDDSYFVDYGLVFYYLDMEDGSSVGLTYRTANSTEPKGTFAISDEEGVDAFLTGMDYYGYPDGSYYETVEGDVYYFVSGSVTLATDEAGNTTITVNATSFYGSTFTVTGVIGGKQPSGDHTIVIADYADVSFETMDGAYTVVSAANGGTSPAYNETSEDLRLYAKNTFTLTSNNAEMTEIVFNISEKGLTRQADIAVSTGEIISYDMGNAKVTWRGNATEVIFTVGATNAHGSDGPTKAGQFDFTSIDIVIPTTELLPVMMSDHIKTFMHEGKMFINANGSIYDMQGNKIH